MNGMAVSMEITYDGVTRCSLAHQSSAAINTCAPGDIGGPGDSFSPTDLMGAALGSCILTTLAMWGERHGLDLINLRAQVIKEMRTEPPRRIRSLVTVVTVPTGKLPVELRERAEQIALACPVHKSLHPEIDAPVKFIYE